VPCFWPVATFCTVMSASGTSPPPESATLPEILPEDGASGSCGEVCDAAGDVRCALTLSDIIQTAAATMRKPSSALRRTLSTFPHREPDVLHTHSISVLRPCYPSIVNIRTLIPATLLVCLLQGCHANPPSKAAEQSRADQRAELETQREQLDMVPPPSKTLYMAVHSFESWQNPYLTIQTGMIELHVTLADGNTSTLGVGGMLRPVGARRQELNISLDTLGEAMAAIPQSAWPYGRVVAIEEAHKVPPAAQPAIRRSMELAIARLNDLGVEVYDPNEGKLQ
jgi:hypothetical protein